MNERNLPWLDPERLKRFERTPVLGPKMLFFSGGSALRSLSLELKRYTFNSVHLITPFDSGGSSAELRRVFRMLGVGDLRSRLLALGDDESGSSADLAQLFQYRLPRNASPAALGHELGEMAFGTHPLFSRLPTATRTLVASMMEFFCKEVPGDFDLRGANVGNLLLTGAYLSNDRDIGIALFLCSKLLGVRGVVVPVADADLHLAARLEDGTLLVGQHLITGKEVAPPSSPVAELHLVRSLSSFEPTEVHALDKALALIGDADLICYPFGSFYTSLVANLLPRGVGQAIAQVHCPKVYVPNWDADSEQRGMTLSNSVERLIEYVRRDAPGCSVRDIVRRVLIDSTNLRYEMELDLDKVERLGVEVIDVDFGVGAEQGRPDPNRIAELLLSLA